MRQLIALTKRVTCSVRRRVSAVYDSQHDRQAVGLAAQPRGLRLRPSRSYSAAADCRIVISSATIRGDADFAVSRLRVTWPARRPQRHGLGIADRLPAAERMLRDAAISRHDRLLSAPMAASADRRAATATRSPVPERRSEVCPQARNEPGPVSSAVGGRSRSAGRTAAGRSSVSHALHLASTLRAVPPGPLRFARWASDVIAVDDPAAPDVRELLARHLAVMSSLEPRRQNSFRPRRQRPAGSSRHAVWLPARRRPAWDRRAEVPQRSPWRAEVHAHGSGRSPRRWHRPGNAQSPNRRRPRSRLPATEPGDRIHGRIRASQGAVRERRVHGVRRRSPDYQASEPVQHLHVAAARELRTTAAPGGRSQPVASCPSGIRRTALTAISSGRASKAISQSRQPTGLLRTAARLPW